jgi:hypothetical protein
VGADNLNYVLRRFLGGFRILWHMVDDVVFHEFTHQAVDGTPGSSETTKNFRALLVVIQSFKNRFELPDDFLRSVDQIRLFSRSVGVWDISLDYPIRARYQSYAPTQ